MSDLQKTLSILIPCGLLPFVLPLAPTWAALTLCVIVGLICAAAVLVMIGGTGYAVVQDHKDAEARRTAAALAKWEATQPAGIRAQQDEAAIEAADIALKDAILARWQAPHPGETPIRCADLRPDRKTLERNRLIALARAKKIREQADHDARAILDGA